MINFQYYLYQSIGNRIRFYRKNVIGQAQADFIEMLKGEGLFMDRQRLSLIENGRNIEGKNPYLLSETQIDLFQKIYKISRTKLLFGEYEERMRLIKLILLSLLMNGVSNTKTNQQWHPFFVDPIEDESEFIRTSMLNLTNQSLKEEATTVFIGHNRAKTKKIVARISDYLHEEYPFFFNKINRRDYQLLASEYEHEFEKSSNLFLKLLFGNLDYSMDFFDSLLNLSQQLDEYKQAPTQLLLNRGQYGDLAIGWLEIRFPLFIKAFNEVWKRHGKRFCDFFQSQLFDCRTEHFSSNNVMKDLTSDYVHSLLTSEEFISLLEELLTIDEYTEETMIGHNYARNLLQTTINENLKDDRIYSKDIYDEEKYFYDVRQLNFLVKQSNKLNAKQSRLALFACNYVEIKKVSE